MRPIIIQYGFMASGSTLIWQILQHLLGNVRKMHGFVPYANHVRLVATFRDFRDCLCTQLVRQNRPFTRVHIEAMVDRFKREPDNYCTPFLKNWETWKGRKNVLWLRYEDFVDNHGLIYAELSSFFGIPIPMRTQTLLSQTYSIEANKKISDRLVSFDKKDVQIHGNHITAEGRVGKWRDLIPPDMHDFVNTALKEELDRFGYVRS